MDETLCSEELLTDHLLAAELLLDQAEDDLSRGAVEAAEGLLRLAEQIAQALR